MSLLLLLRARVFGALASLPVWGKKKRVRYRAPANHPSSRLIMPMTPKLQLVEGWTAPVPLTLEENGEPAPLGGLNVTPILHDKDGNAVAAGAVAITDAAAGEIDWTPPTLDADLSPYWIRFDVQGANGKVFFPHVGLIRFSGRVE